MKRLFTGLLALLGIYQATQAMGTFRSFGTRAFQAVRDFQVQEPDKATRRLKVALLGATAAGQYGLLQDGYKNYTQAEKVHPFGKFIASGTKKEQTRPVHHVGSVISPQEALEFLEEEAISYVQNNETLQNILKHKYTRYAPTALAAGFFLMNAHFMKTVYKQAMSQLSLFEKCCRKMAGLDYTNK